MKAETVKLTMIAAQLALSTNLAKTEIKSWQSRGLSSEGGGRRSSFPPFYSSPDMQVGGTIAQIVQHAKEAQMPLIATDIMTSKVITARPDDTLAKIAGLLFDHGISAVPICDKDGGVLGMLSEGDLMRPLGKEKASKRAWWLNLLAEGTDLAPNFVESVKVENHLARELMVTPVITAPANSTVPELADLLGRHHIKRLPILRDGKLIGIVSRADVVRAIARTPDEIAEAI